MMGNLKQIIKHRQLVTPLNVTLICVSVALLMKLPITAIVIALNPFCWRYVAKMFVRIGG